MKHAAFASLSAADSLSSGHALTAPHHYLQKGDSRAVPMKGNFSGCVYDGNSPQAGSGRSATRRRAEPSRAQAQLAPAAGRWATLALFDPLQRCAADRAGGEPGSTASSPIAVEGEEAAGRRAGWRCLYIVLLRAPNWVLPTVLCRWDAAGSRVRATAAHGKACSPLGARRTG